MAKNQMTKKMAKRAILKRIVEFQKAEGLETGRDSIDIIVDTMPARSRERYGPNLEPLSELLTELIPLAVAAGED